MCNFKTDVASKPTRNAFETCMYSNSLCAFLRGNCISGFIYREFVYPQVMYEGHGLQTWSMDVKVKR